MSGCQLPVNATLGLLAVGLLTGDVIAAEKKMLPAHNVGGYIDVSKTEPYTLRAHPMPRELPAATAQQMKTRGNAQAARAARAFMKKFPETTGIMLLDRGRVVFEATQGVGKATSEFYSMSIGKSMTSMAIGQALCTGHLESLDVLAGDLVPKLKVNRLGESSVRHLLMMSSGAYQNVHSGGPAYRGGIGVRPRTGKPFQGASWPMRLGQVTVDDLLWGDGWNRTLNRNVNQPGARFIYKSLDTLALGKIIETTTKMSTAAYFEQTVWRSVRTAHAGHWEADKDRSTMSNSGFQARLRDWGRLAIWILDERKKPGCFGNYLRDATIMQIETASPFAKNRPSFRGYGYQWWVKHRNTPGFWGLGFAGQRLGINPETDKVLIKFGYRLYDGVDAGIFKLFREWNSAS